MDQHIADLLGLDLTDPETIAAIARAEEESRAEAEQVKAGRDAAAG